MQMEGVDSQGLTRRHGLLIAFGWVDQNTAPTPVIWPGVVVCCYRATRYRLRALNQARDRGRLREPSPLLLRWLNPNLGPRPAQDEEGEKG